MHEHPISRSVAIFFYAGDFADVLRRKQSGEQQIYATHNEVAQLIFDLREQNIAVTIYSYITDERKEETPLDGVRIVSLGANSETRGVLKSAVASVDADTIIAHFAFPELLKAVASSDKRVFAGLANSYNDVGIRQYLRRLRISRLLNKKNIRMITNHCIPATEHLAHIGIRREKLVPWDIPHRFHPSGFESKILKNKAEYSIAYAGSIAELKGVGDLIRAVALLKSQGIGVKASFAGLGDIAEMEALARSLGVADSVIFKGIVGNDDVFRMFRDADMVAVPSRTSYPEGFPLTMFEAIASRSPIVCSNHPMFTPVMNDGNNCVMFESGDVDGFAQAIGRLVTSSDLYGRLSQAAELTWRRLQGPADWRTLMSKWVTEGENSAWVSERRLKKARSAWAPTPGARTLPFSINVKYMD